VTTLGAQVAESISQINPCQKGVLLGGILMSAWAE